MAFMFVPVFTDVSSTLSFRCWKYRSSANCCCLVIRSQRCSRISLGLLRSDFSISWFTEEMGICVLSRIALLLSHLSLPPSYRRCGTVSSPYSTPWSCDPGTWILTPLFSILPHNITCKDEAVAKRMLHPSVYCYSVPPLLLECGVATWTGKQTRNFHRSKKPQTAVISDTQSWSRVNRRTT